MNEYTMGTKCVQAGYTPGNALYTRLLHMIDQILDHNITRQIPICCISAALQPRMTKDQMQDHVKITAV